MWLLFNWLELGIFSKANTDPSVDSAEPAGESDANFGFSIRSRRETLLRCRSSLGWNLAFSAKRTQTHPWTRRNRPASRMPTLALASGLAEKHCCGPGQVLAGTWHFQQSEHRPIRGLGGTGRRVGCQLWL